MTKLPDPVSRELVHTRAITMQGFLRQDGLWDLEAELTDIKTHPTASMGDVPRAIGEPVHRMMIRLTIDDSYKIHEAVAAMPHTPFDECLPATEPFANMVGVVMGPGWRKQIDLAMGGIAGCTHLRELLTVMATVAYQTIRAYRRSQHKHRGETPAAELAPGHQMGKCISWDYNGAVVARISPQFIGYTQAKKAET